MKTTSAVAEQLRGLAGDPDRGERLVAGLNQLGADVSVAVPSCLAVSIVLRRLDTEIVVSALMDGGEAAVLASLAVPLSAGEPCDTLVLRAGEAGAFLLLAADLAGLLGAGRSGIEVDRHLGAPVLGAESLAASLADLSRVNQAIGALLDRGWTAEAAMEELRRRARVADTSVSVACGRLLAAVTRAAEPA